MLRGTRYRLAWYTRKVRVGVIGAYAAGKTSFIRALSEVFDSIATRRYVSGVGVYESTLAYDYGVLYAVRSGDGLRRVSSGEAASLIEEGHDGVYRVELWGAAGQGHLAAARQAIIYPRVDGVILFFDPSRKESFELSLSLYREAKDSIPGLGVTKPIVVVFNKIDLVGMDDALRLARRTVRFMDETYVVGRNLFFTSVKENRGVWRPLESFIFAV